MIKINLPAHVKHRLDQARWQLIATLKIALKDQDEPLCIMDYEGGPFHVNRHGMCQDFLADKPGELHVAWDDMSWTQLACVARDFT